MVSEPECRASRINVRAAAKINLRLRILGVRSDGYHILDGIVVPISLYDRLTFSLTPARKGYSIRLVCNRSDLPIDHNNLVAKAADLFLGRVPVSVDLSVEIGKEIPMGAGLGGGSSDAAVTLLALNRLTGAGIDQATLLHWAAELGADVPFFVIGRPARVRGIGELIEPVSWDRPCTLVVAYPGTALSTAAVYAAYDRSLTTREEDSNLQTFSRGLDSLQALLANDLEAVASQLYPPVRALKERLLELGASAALMTGSGSAVFGVWEKRELASSAAERLRVEDGVWARTAEVLERIPPIFSE